MGYREQRLEGAKATLVLDGESYDVDGFGMDDGRSDDPDAAFRFLFQLGYGYLIYLYVIQTGALGRHRFFFHTLWLKDCAVAEVAMEDRGPPARVECAPCALPVLYESVTLGAATYGIVSQTFSAGGGRAKMTIGLCGRDGGVATLEWDREDGWLFGVAQDGPRPLDPALRLWFSPAGEE